MVANGIYPSLLAEDSCPSTSYQAIRKMNEFFLLLNLCSIQTFNRLDNVHPHQGEQSNLLIQFKSHLETSSQTHSRITFNPSTLQHSQFHINLSITTSSHLNSLLLWEFLHIRKHIRFLMQKQQAPYFLLCQSMSCAQTKQCTVTRIRNPEK